MKKTLLIILDGLGDRPIKSFGGKTPLEAANTPNMDALATSGICGVMNAIPEKLYPTSEEAHLAIFGYDFVREHPGRGVLEALGIGMKLKSDELAFRANFGTVDEKLRLTDARAGVIDSVKELCRAVDNIEIDNVKFRIFPSLQHRAVLVASGEPVKKYIKEMDSRRNLSAGEIPAEVYAELRFSAGMTPLRQGFAGQAKGGGNDPRTITTRLRKTTDGQEYGAGNGRMPLISDTDPHKAGPHKLGVRVLHPKAAVNSKEGKTVARALERYQLLTHEILNEHKINKKRVKKGKLPANFVLTRGCGHLKEIKNFKDKYGFSSSVCIAGAPLYKGIASYLGMKVVKVRGATGKLDTNVGAKVKAVETALKKNDFVFLHIKGADMAAEDYGDAKLKKEFIEKIDKAFDKLLGLKNVTIAVTGDHATPCELKDHSSDAVPVLMWTSDPRLQASGKDSVNKFGESYCKKGRLGHIYGKELMKYLLGVTNYK